MKSLKSIILMSSILLSTGMTNVMADDVAIIPIQKPAVLEEGTQRELTATQIAELLPWAKDSKAFLLDLLDNTQALTMTDKVDRLIEGIKSSVIDSAPKNSELLMRYALNRAVVINEILDREMDADAVGTIDAKARVLNLSIKMALKYYDADMATLSKKTASPFAAFGIEYFSFLTELNKSIFDASAQYNIQRTSLEWLQWDLYRDLNNAQYASQILKINNALKTFPTRKISDAQSISYVRQMKKVSEQLNIIMKKNEENNSGTTTVFNSSSSSVSNSGKYANALSGKYKSSGGTCYAMSTTGDYLKSVSWDNCFAGKYQSSGGTCYAMSVNGEYLKSVGWESCFSGNYKSSGGTCYAMSTNNEYLQSVNWDNCFSGKYRSSGGTCYAMSTNGEYLHEADYTKCM